MTSTNTPWDPYYDANAPGWRAGAVDRFAQDHQIDPNTGLLTGPTSLPPWQLARQYQAAHNQAIWERQQRYMDQAQRQLADATRFQQGALGLLSSYRAGGSQALASGIYNQVAGGMRSQAAGSFQRAQMTQPLDYESDLRRHEGAQASRRAERASERAMYTQLGVALINNTAAAISGGGGAGGGSGGSGGLTISQSAFEGGGGTADAGTQSVLGGAGGAVQGGGAAASGQTGGGEQASAATLEPEQPTAGGPQPLQSGGQAQQPQGSPFEGGGGVDAQTQPFGPPQPGVGAPQPGAQGGNQPVPGGPGVGAGAGAGGGMLGAGPVMGGADGNFAHDALAASTVMQDPVVAPAAQMALNDYVADMYERDPFYQSLHIAIQNRWNDRMTTGAA